MNNIYPIFKPDLKPLEFTIQPQCFLMPVELSKLTFIDSFEACVPLFPQNVVWLLVRRMNENPCPNSGYERH